MNLYNEIPEKIMDILNKEKRENNAGFEELVRQGGYLPSGYGLINRCDYCFKHGEKYFIEEARCG